MALGSQRQTSVDRDNWSRMPFGAQSNGDLLPGGIDRSPPESSERCVVRGEASFGSPSPTARVIAGAVGGVCAAVVDG